eukprot:g3929.t1
MAKRERRKIWTAALTIFACTISGGLLALPAVYYDAGVVPSLCLTFLSAITTACSIFALTAISDANDDIKGYGQLFERVTNWKHSKKIMSATVALFLTGVVGSTFIVVRDLLSESIDDTPVVDSLTVVVAVVVFALSLPKDLGKLSHVAIISTLSFCFMLATIVYYGSNRIHDDGDEAVRCWFTPGKYDDNAESPSNVKRFEDIAKALPVILYSFGCQFQIIDIYYSFGRGGVSTFTPVICIAVSLMFCLFSVCGVFGVAAFADQGNDDIDGDVLKVLGKKGHLGKVSSIVLVGACVLAAPLIVLPARSSLLSLLSTPSTAVERRIAATCLIVSVATALAVSRVKFLVVIGGMGAFLCSPLFFVLPGCGLLFCCSASGDRHPSVLVGGVEGEKKMEEGVEVGAKEKNDASFDGRCAGVNCAEGTAAATAASLSSQLLPRHRRSADRGGEAIVRNRRGVEVLIGILLLSLGSITLISSVWAFVSPAFA